MPCNTIQKSQVNLTKMNPELAESALRSLGYHVRMQQSGIYATKGYTQVTISLSGEVSLTARDSEIAQVGNELKRAYSVQVVQAASRKFGWNLKQQSETKFAVSRRF